MVLGLLRGTGGNHTSTGREEYRGEKWKSGEAEFRSDMYQLSSLQESSKMLGLLSQWIFDFKVFWLLLPFQVWRLPHGDGILQGEEGENVHNVML